MYTLKLMALIWPAIITTLLQLQYSHLACSHQKAPQVAQDNGTANTLRVL